MNKSNSASKIKMKSFDDLFGTNENLEQANANGGEIREIPLASLHTFRNHPFQIHEDKLEEMVESVRQYGVLVPGIARMRPQGGYEIIAGHTRKAACELAGLDTMPMFIRNLNDDEATIVMVDSNIQREDIFPSEKARAYSMRYYAMKHQGIKGDKGSSLDIMSEETGENAKKIQRYIRLAKLSDELLDFVDRKKIGFIQGVDLSYLNEEQQQWVLDIILDRNIFPNIEQSARLKASCRENMLTQEEVRNIMLPEQVLAKPRKVTFKADRLDDYFDEGYTEEKITEVAEQFGESRRSVKAAFDRLEEIGVIRREFRNIETNSGMVLNNVMYIDLCVDRLYTCTYLNIPGDDEDVENTGEEIQKQAENQANKSVTKFCTSSYKTLYDPPTKFCTTLYKISYDPPAKFCNTLPQNDVPPHTKFCKTNTENTTENTEEITYPIIPSGTGVKTDTMDRMDEVRSFIKDNIDYDGLLQCHPTEKMDINELVELMVETIAVKQPVIRINKYDFPYDVVRSRLEKIDFHTMEYVLECLRNNTTKVRNIRSYMLTTLYNAPVTCSNYYKAEVNHDFYGK